MIIVFCFRFVCTYWYNIMYVFLCGCLPDFASSLFAGLPAKARCLPVVCQFAHFVVVVVVVFSNRKRLAAVVVSILVQVKIRPRTFFFFREDVVMIIYYRLPGIVQLYHSWTAWPAQPDDYNTTDDCYYYWKL